MKHKHTQPKIITVWIAFGAGAALLCAPEKASASDGYPSGYKIIPGKAVKRPAPVRQKRAFRPIVPVSMTSQPQSAPVSQPGEAVPNPAYVDYVPAPTPQTVTTSFNPHPQSRLSSPSVPTNPSAASTESAEVSLIEPTPSWGYTVTEVTEPEVAPPPIPKPDPKPVVKKPAPKKSSYSSKKSSYSSKSRWSRGSS